MMRALLQGILLGPHKILNLISLLGNMITLPMRLGTLARYPISGMFGEEFRAAIVAPLVTTR